MPEPPQASLQALPLEQPQVLLLEEHD